MGFVSKDQVIEWFRPFYVLMHDIREMPEADVVPIAEYDGSKYIAKVFNSEH